MSKDKIVIRQWRKTGHRSPLATTTINTSVELHARYKKIRDMTGLTYNEILSLAIEYLEEKLVVKP